MAGPEPHNRIALKRIAHAYYKYADLETAIQFLTDFGFSEEKRVSEDKIYFRGYGTEPWVICAVRNPGGQENEFGGVAYIVESEEDLRIASETLPKASKIYELEDAPGGGKCVTFLDPVDGFPFHLVWGQETAHMLDIPLPHEPVNYVSFILVTKLRFMLEGLILMNYLLTLFSLLRRIGLSTKHSVSRNGPHLSISSDIGVTAPQTTPRLLSFTQRGSISSPAM
jgi:hypothetical protein